MKDKQVSLRMPVDLLAEVDRLAGELHSSRSAVINDAVKRLVKERDDTEAVVATMDSLSESIERSERQLTERLARGLAEVHDRLGKFETRLDSLEEFQAHHLFNFLAYVAPDADETAAATRGRKRMIEMVRMMDNIRSGKMTGLLAQARQDMDRRKQGDMFDNET
jgi:predicted transcriptional regulator